MQVKHTIFEDSEVHVFIGGQNELCIYSKVDDPPKLRLGAPTDGLGAISFNLVVDGREQEMVLVMGKGHDPDSPGDSLKCGALDVQVQLEGTHDDAGMKKGLLLTPHRLNVRVPLETSSSVPPTQPADLWPPSHPGKCGHQGTDAATVQLYRTYMGNSVQLALNRPASAAQLNLVDEFMHRYGYVDDCGFNWMVSTFIVSGAVA